MAAAAHPPFYSYFQIIIYFFIHRFDMININAFGKEVIA